jgi:hypothetical protein
LTIEGIQIEFRFLPIRDEFAFAPAAPWAVRTGIGVGE